MPKFTNLGEKKLLWECHLEIFAGREAHFALEGIDEGGARLEADTEGNGLNGDVAVTGALLTHAAAGLTDAHAGKDIAEGGAIVLVDDLRDIRGV